MGLEKDDWARSKGNEYTRNLRLMGRDVLTNSKLMIGPPNRDLN